jgi:hypothetical protein
MCCSATFPRKIQAEAKYSLYRFRNVSVHLTPSGLVLRADGESRTREDQKFLSTYHRGNFLCPNVLVVFRERESHHMLAQRAFHTPTLPIPSGFQLD